MATVIRPELSEKNKYWIEKHRYYELKHFCLQYPTWKQAYVDCDGISSCTYDPVTYFRSGRRSDPTARMAELRLLYFNNMKVIENAAFEADATLSGYILKAVTEGLSYTQLKTKMSIPCSRDTYYDRYRRFFWLLDRTKY